MKLKCIIAAAILINISNTLAAKLIVEDHNNYIKINIENLTADEKNEFLNVLNSTMEQEMIYVKKTDIKKLEKDLDKFHNTGGF